MGIPTAFQAKKAGKRGARFRLQRGMTHYWKLDTLVIIAFMELCRHKQQSAELQ